MVEQPQLGKIVRFHRKKSGLSQADFAKMIGVGKTVVYDLEKGKESIQLDTLNKILSGLNISVSLTSQLMKEYTDANS